MTLKHQNLEKRKRTVLRYSQKIIFSKIWSKGVICSLFTDIKHLKMAAKILKNGPKTSKKIKQWKTYLDIPEVLKIIFSKKWVPGSKSVTCAQTDIHTRKQKQMCFFFVFCVSVFLLSYDRKKGLKKGKHEHLKKTKTKSSDTLRQKNRFLRQKL